MSGSGEIPGHLDLSFLLSWEEATFSVMVSSFVRRTPPAAEQRKPPIRPLTDGRQGGGRECVISTYGNETGGVGPCG